MAGCNLAIADEENELFPVRCFSAAVAEDRQRQVIHSENRSRKPYPPEGRGLFAFVRKRCCFGIIFSVGGAINTRNQIDIDNKSITGRIIEAILMISLYFFYKSIACTRAGLKSHPMEIPLFYTLLYSLLGLLSQP
jgi:hypothetical protein